MAGMKILGVVLLLMAVALPCVGQEGRRATVRLDGRSVLEVGAVGTDGAVVRARAIEARLMALLDESESPGMTTVVAEGDSVRLLLVDSAVIARVHRADARRENNSLDATALQWSRQVDAALADAVERRIGIGGRFGSTLLGAVRTAFARVIESAVHNIPRFLAAVLVLLLFWGLAYITRRALRWTFRHTLDDLTIENLVRQVAYAVIWTMGIIVAVGALGWDPSAVATGLGLTGLALGFALKDILSNFVSGVLLLTLRPFRVGDQIIVGETEGTVRRIELRATHIGTYDGRIALVPNADVFTSRVINNTATPVRRGSVSVRIGYRERLDVAVEAVLAGMRGADGVIDHPEPSVQISELGDDIVLDARFWTDSRRSDFQETASNVRSALVRRLADSGVTLPDPDLRRVEPGAREVWRDLLHRPER
jgi:small-conductance mechanosensitive channel